MKTIDIIVLPSGELQIEATGFIGLDCEKATAFLEQALGDAKSRYRKPEYYRQIRRKQINSLGQ